MQEIWKRIENWLRVNAPSILAHLPEGASDADLSAAESRLSVQLPDDFRESYRLHNGSGAVWLFGFESYGLDDIAGTWECQQIPPRAGHEEEPVAAHGPIREEECNAMWIPVGGNQCGDHLMLDLAPAQGGTMGQLFWWDHEDWTAEILANGWRDFLTRFATDLESGRYYAYDSENSRGLAWVTLPDEEFVLTYRLVLIEIGPRRIEVLRAVHQIFNIPLAEAKALLSSGRPVLGIIRRYERPQYQARFDALGATVEFEPAQRSTHAQGIRRLDQGRPNAAE